MPTKSDLSFDELLKAGLNTPPQPAQPPRTKSKQGRPPRGKKKRATSSRPHERG